MSILIQSAWPLSRLSEALEVLAHHAKLQMLHTDVLTPDRFSSEYENCLSLNDIETWLQWACNEYGIELETLEAPVPDVEDLLRRVGPAVIRHVHEGRFYVILLLKVRSENAVLVAPNQRLVNHPLALLRSSLAGPAEQIALSEVEEIITSIPSKNRQKARGILLTELSSSINIHGIWMLRAPPSGRFWPQFVSEKLLSKLVFVLILSAALYGAELSAWTLIGKGALGGQFSSGWLLAWALLLLVTVLLGLLVYWVQGIFSIGFGSLLKQRLLAGALRMSPDVLRSQGVGQLLGRVMESQAFDSMVLGGGLGMLVALVELVFAAWVLSIGAGGTLHVFLLFGWVLLTFFTIVVFYKKHRQWTESRLDLTHDFVEKMVGHRTRLVQELPTNRHVFEDQQLSRYLEVSKRFDQSALPLVAGIGRGWLVVGLLGMAPAFIGDSRTTVSLAISLGGVLLASRALSQLVGGGAGIVQACIAWEKIGAMFKATAQPLESSMPVPEGKAQKPDTAGSEIARNNGCIRGVKEHPNVLIQARNLNFGYPNQSKPLISECSLTILKGEHILLEGPSGGGKSTLAALLTGLRQQDSGLLLLNGLDRSSWGNSWCQQCTSAPQFHENHILTGTLAFNLLMGRTWPASTEDMAEAEALCLQLGLGSLIKRMPSGLLQMVGESGWQLSHGERSRVYLARALLQNADLVVLDESFAALDPKTLTQCLKCALTRASSLLVIAHP